MSGFVRAHNAAYIYRKVGQYAYLEWSQEDVKALQKLQKVGCLFPGSLCVCLGGGTCVGVCVVCVCCVRCVCISCSSTEQLHTYFISNRPPHVTTTVRADGGHCVAVHIRRQLDRVADSAHAKTSCVQTDLSCNQCKFSRNRTRNNHNRGGNTAFR